MENHDNYIRAASALGFTHAVSIADFALKCEAEIRAYCNAEQCRNYASTWVCPPGCGTVEECQSHASNYRAGIVLQTVGDIPPIGKETTLRGLQKKHNANVLKLADMARSEGIDVLPLTTGGCPVCKSCTFPNEPCRDPERRMHSLSAYGINVGNLCKTAELEYSFRNDKVYFTAYLGFNISE